MAANFHWIVPGEAARSAQLPAMWLGPFLAAGGIKSLINLRGAHPEFRWWRKEERACLRNGVRYLNAMLDSRLLPTRAMLATLWDCFDRAREHPPLLIKCWGGQDRTSLAAALYLLERGGWSAMEETKAQFTRWPFLHFPRPQQRWLAAFPEFARESANGAPIGNLVRGGYDPRALADWLEKMVGPGSFKGIYAAREP